MDYSLLYSPHRRRRGLSLSLQCNNTNQWWGGHVTSEPLTSGPPRESLCTLTYTWGHSLVVGFLSQSETQPANLLLKVSSVTRSEDSDAPPLRKVVPSLFEPEVERTKRSLKRPDTETHTLSDHVSMLVKHLKEQFNQNESSVLIS